VKKKARPKRGRPPLPIPAKTVEELAARGCTVEEIAGILGCSRDTIERNFAAQVALGRNRLAEKLRGKQVDLAMNGSVPLLIWLGKQYLGQKEKSEAVVREEVVTIEEIAPKVQHDA
jgi:AraC-like DNA-binding protein